MQLNYHATRRHGCTCRLIHLHGQITTPALHSYTKAQVPPCPHGRFNASTCEQHSSRYCITCSIHLLPREANWQFTTTECTKERRDFHTGSGIRHSNSQAPIQPVDTSPCRHRHGGYKTVLHTVQVRPGLVCRCCASLSSHNLCLT